jgi:hypothetical protein
VIKRLILAVALMIVALGIAAPYVQADRYGEQIRNGLQRGLNRKVKIGTVHFNLFTGPGFTIENVIIYDDPSVGIEPFAHMLELEARVRLSSLWTRQIDFSTLRFVSPSVNIVKPDTGAWNVVRLMQDAKSATSVPEIQVTDGRIYLKTGDTKSAFYIGSADVTVTPGRDSLYFRFSGEPARTDRAARTAGLFSARGTFSNGKLDMDLELEKSPVNELGGLLRGARLGYHGTVASRAKVYGPLSNLSVTGSFNLSDVHRWDMMNEHNRSWTVNYKGKVDSFAERIDLATTDNPNKLHVVVSDWMKQPQWSIDAAVTELAASTLVSVARDLGAPMPKGVAVDGRVVGRIGFASLSGLQGELAVSDGTVQLQDGPQLKLADASLFIAGDSFRLAPTALVGEEGQGAQLEGDYNVTTRALNATISGQGLRLLSRAAVPLVNRFQGGKWSAALRYSQDDDAPGVWKGSFDVRDTTTRVPGVASPIRISTARIDIDGDALNVRQMRALIGPLEVYGSYAYDPTGQRPHRFDFTVPNAAMADVEQLLAPALRRDEGFFARTLRLRRAALPEWLEHRKAEGSVRIGVLTAGDVTARAIRSRVVWNGGAVQLTAFEGRFEDGSFKGTGVVDITKSEPQYKLRGSIQNFSWKSGKVDLDGAVETLGSGLDLLLNLRGEGTFQARGVILSPEQVVRTASGGFGLSLTAKGPQFKLSDVQASLGSERFTGDGMTLADGRLQMELASANRIVHVNVDVAR